jgi:hypothetical protein
MTRWILFYKPRAGTWPETRHVGLRHQLAELLVQVAIDVRTRYRDGNVPLAGAAVVDALNALNTARASLVTSHKGLGRIAKALRIPVKMDGKPNISEEDDDRILRVAS